LFYSLLLVSTYGIGIRYVHVEALIYDWVI
jgi:hypothetical protein